MDAIIFTVVPTPTEVSTFATLIDSITYCLPAVDGKVNTVVSKDVGVK